MLIQLMLGIAMFVGLGVLILQSHPFRPLAAGLLMSPVRPQIPQKRRGGMSLQQGAVDEWENEGGAAQPSKL
jgi:hypothetical protein